MTYDEFSRGPAALNQTSGNSSMANALIRRGIAKTEAGANSILITLSIIMIGIGLLLIFKSRTRVSNNGPSMTPEAELEYRKLQEGQR